MSHLPRSSRRDICSTKNLSFQALAAHAQITKVANRIAAATNRITTTTNRTTAVTSRIAAITNRIAALTNRIAATTNRITMTTNRTTAVTSGITAITSRIAVIDRASGMCVKPDERSESEELHSLASEKSLKLAGLGIARTTKFMNFTEMAS
jgi:septal ring factor EnvC (AmiA/AmiB activator)